VVKASQEHPDPELFLCASLPHAWRRLGYQVSAPNTSRWLERLQVICETRTRESAFDDTMCDTRYP